MNRLAVPWRKFYCLASIGIISTLPPFLPFVLDLLAYVFAGLRWSSFLEHGVLGPRKYHLNPRIHQLEVVEDSEILALRDQLKYCND